MTTGGAALRGGLLGARSAARSALGGRGGGNLARPSPPFPPPVGKAGFEVWVFSKGGLVCIATCRSVRTVGSHHPVVHAHHVRGGTLTLGCVRV